MITKLKENEFISSINEDSITIGTATTTVGVIRFKFEQPLAPSMLEIVLWTVLIVSLAARLVPFFSKK